jgi:hypothetical protein
MRTRLALLVLAFSIFSAQISSAQDSFSQASEQMGAQVLDMNMQQAAMQAQLTTQQAKQQMISAMQQAMGSSVHASPAFLIPAEPKHLPKPGEYAITKPVATEDATPGVTVHCTTDESRPTAASPVYTGPIPVNSSMAIFGAGRAARTRNQASPSGSATTRCEIRHDSAWDQARTGTARPDLYKNRPPR